MTEPKTSLETSSCKEEFVTGATRDDRAGKGRPSLISPVLIHRVSKHLAAGEEHYGKDNWTKGMPFCRTADSLIRHSFQWLATDNSEDHLAAIVCNAMFLMHYEEAIKAESLPTSLDDRSEAFKKIVPSLLTSVGDEPRVESAAQGSWWACCGELWAPGVKVCFVCGRDRRDEATGRYR